MKLDDFDNNVNPTILSRGYDYFLNEAVTHLQDMKFGTWASLVVGAQDYSVVIKLDNDEIKEWDCNCPYDHGPICKHVVASLYAIGDGQEILSKPTTKKKHKKIAKKNEIGEIFSKVDKQELQDYLQQQFSASQGMKNSFIAYFAEYLDEDIYKKYQTIVQNIYKAAIGSYGFIDYRSTYKLERPLNDLINKAYDLASRNKTTEAIAISKTIIENVPKFIHHMDDSDGSAGGLFSDAFNLFTEICEHAHPELKDDLFKYCLKEFPKEKYSDFCFDDDFLGVLPILVTTKKHENQFLKILDKQIEKAKLSSSSYSLVRYIQEKINYYLNNNQEKKAQALIFENKNYSDIRKTLVNQEIEAEHYAQAKELILKGIEIAKEQRHPGTVNEWYKLLLKIAGIECNTNDIRKWSEILFKNNSRDMDYYKKLKSTFPSREWEIKCESIIEDIKGRNQYGGYGLAEELANIFIVEKYFDRLLALLQINPTKIDLTNRYAHYLLDKHPKEIINLYASGIKKHAEKAGRPIYNQVVAFMKTMSSIPESQFVIDKLIQYFKEKYKNRRAMMEVLNSSFPNK